MSVSAECRVCGNSAAADSFRLHHEYKQMVCPNCYSGRTKQLQKQELERKKEAPKPAGWDKEDEYLEKAAQVRKEQNQAQFRKIQGTNQVKCTCFACKYEFRYDPFRKMPRTCPYCNENIPKLRTFNLL